MLTFGERLGEVAVRLAHKFSDEIGESVIHHFAGDVYDPDTGVNVPSYTDESCLIVFSEISEGSAYDAQYMFEHGLAIVAGGLVLTAPVTGDMITTPSGTTHSITGVKHDQYQDAFMCHYMKVPQA